MEIEATQLGIHNSWFRGKIKIWFLEASLKYLKSQDDEDDPNSVAKEVALLFQKIVMKEDEGGVLKELNFSGCNLKDVDIWEMLS